MSLREITEQIHTLGSAWESFKQMNNRRLEEIEQKGNADPITVKQVDRLNDIMDGCKDRLNRIETMMGRPSLDMQKDMSFCHSEDREYKEAFCNYIRRGIDMPLSQLESKSLSVGSRPDGGYLVTPTIAHLVSHHADDASSLRNLASYQVISSDILEMIIDKEGADAGWTTEKGPVEETHTPKLRKKHIDVHELYAQPKATQKLIDDASIDIEKWLAEKISDVFTKKENAAFIHGDGNGKPYGILSRHINENYMPHVIEAGESVTSDSLLTLLFSLKEPYMQNASFLMNRATLQYIRGLKEEATGRYIWQPGLTEKTPDNLLGIRVVQSPDMPLPEKGAAAIIIGDFKKGYQIVDRTSIRILRDPYTEKPFVKFYATKRVGGDVLDEEALKVLKI